MNKSKFSQDPISLAVVGKRGWHHQVASYERALQESRDVWKQAATKRKYRRRREFERLVGRMTRLGGREARAWGIAFARSHAHCIAAINNLGACSRQGSRRGSGNA